MLTSAKCTERELLLGYLDQQLAAIRAAAYGFTEEQAAETPCRSETPFRLRRGPA